MSRSSDLDHFYELLEDLQTVVGGTRTLEDSSGYMDWPDQGVYFFLSENNRTAGTEERVTRIGTHAVAEGSSASLWSRLKAHQGSMNSKYGENGGNHRGSVFRLRVGEAMIERSDLHNAYPEWGQGSHADPAVRRQEHDHEQQVSEYIRKLPMVWLTVEDYPAPDNERAYIERNAIALVSNYQKTTIDPREDNWLGNASPKSEIAESGLWNVNHVEEEYDPSFLNRFEELIREMDT
ncbi:hypothetical protein V5735_13000 (plasmid) [Haladaptatus sp. SPP-AMP-3]|uniref:hypothetical protein n=1 Tax=Haladaptatus sp. SPP-AMP-3 TaxID=3121295 RepID=UPI003C2D64CC